MKKAIDVLVDQEPIELPHHVVCAMGDTVTAITFFGDQLSFGEDYLSLQEARDAIAWYVDQLGGKVKWRKK